MTPDQIPAGDIPEGERPHAMQQPSENAMETNERTDESDREDQIRQLLDAAARLRDEYAEAPVSTSRLLNPLLDLWAMASGLGEEATGPIEQALTVYNGPRDLALPDELAELHEQLSSALRGAMV